MRKVWINGKILPDSEANLSIWTSSVNWGDGIFEMMRTYRKKTFKLREHLDRLYASARYLDIEIPYCLTELYEAHENLLIENRYEFDEYDEIRSLIHVDRGILPIYKDSGLKLGTKVIIACWPLKWIIPEAYKTYTDGVPAVITHQKAIPAELLDPKIKNRSRIHYKMADMEAKRSNPNAWAILTDPDGFIAESTGSNIFLVKNRELFTPEPRNCLRGISRKYVMRLAERFRIEVFERNLDLYDLLQSDECFTTCTPYGMVPVISINGKLIGNGKPGKLTKHLMNKWAEEVNCDFVEQTRRWAGGA